MRRFLLSVVPLLSLYAAPVFAQEASAASPGASLDDANILWTCLAAFLVFFMQAGFAFVEAGFTRAKNVCNIFMKNLMDLSAGSIVFWMVGFGIMFGLGTGLIGTSGFFFDPVSTTTAGKTLAEVAGQSESFSWAFLIFQTVFCATAATIVSGAMAERTRFVAYLLYSVFICAFVYPVFGHWAWGSLYFGDAGQGWLERLGFMDFAGSTVVHSVGGWAALAGAIVLGARLGKYKNGKAQPIPGHNMSMGTLGVFILWLGWFGFNSGSTTAIEGGSLARIAVVTNLAAAAGAIGAMTTSWFLSKKPDISMSLNGALAGLVAITAGCDVITPTWALATGLAAGLIVVASIRLIEKMRIDDPVGAISVHGVCGAWGTLAIGLFAEEKGLLLGYGASQLGIQAVGVLAALSWVLPVSFAIFFAIKYTVGLRVSAAEEHEGLDRSEHGISAYEGDIPGVVTPAALSTPMANGLDGMLVTKSS